MLRIQSKALEGVVAEALRKQKAGLEITKEEQAILDKEVGIQQEILALERSKTDQAVIREEANVAALKVQQEELAAFKELNSVINTGLGLEKEIFELRMKSFGFESGDFAAKSAQQTLAIELQKLELAKEEANLKFEVIAAENALLSAKRREQQFFNNQEIANLDS